MRVGFYKEDLKDFEGVYDVDNADYIQEIAQDFADNNHEIVEASDYKFTVYVQDIQGAVYSVELFTEFDPRYEVESCSLLN